MFWFLRVSIFPQEKTRTVSLQSFGCATAVPKLWHLSSFELFLLHPGCYHPSHCIQPPRLLLVPWKPIRNVHTQILHGRGWVEGQAEASQPQNKASLRAAPMEGQLERPLGKKKRKGWNVCRREAKPFSKLPICLAPTIGCAQKFHPITPL